MGSSSPQASMLSVHTGFQHIKTVCDSAGSHYQLYSSLFWNGVNRAISEETKSLVEEKTERRKQFFLRAKEIETYNIKIFETSLFLQKIFEFLRDDLWRTGEGFRAKNSDSEYPLLLKYLARKKRNLTLVEAFEANYKAICLELKPSVIMPPLFFVISKTSFLHSS